MMTKTKKLKIKTTIIDVVIVGTLVATTIVVGLTLPTGETMFYASAGLFGLGAFCGFVHSKLMLAIEGDTIPSQYEKELAMYLDGNYTPPTAATDVSRGGNDE